MEKDIRVMNTTTLIEVADRSSAKGYSHAVNPIWIRRYADVSGYHVARVLIWNNQEGDSELTPHHRIEVLMKTPETGYPTTIVIDITASLWDWLYTVDEWKALEEELKKPNPNLNNICKKFGSHLSYTDA